MKIKKFEELNERVITDYAYIHGNNVGIMDDMDFKRVHRSGRKAYIVNHDYDLVEVKTKIDITRSKRNGNFPHVVFLSDDKIERTQKLIKNTEEVEKLYKKKIKLLFDYVITYAQKDLEEGES